jgi:membrane-bound lytic murein transglycosylase B
MPAGGVTTLDSSPPAGPAARITAPLAAPLDASSIATEFENAFAVILDPTSPPPKVEAAGVQLQLVLRYLANHSDLDADVLAALGPVSAPSLRRIIAARQLGQAHAAADPTPTEPPTTLPAWTIAAPEDVVILRSFYDEAERLTGVPWYWLAAIHLQETRMGRIVGVSVAGAVGPMQFLPTTWADCCVGDPLSTHDAIIGAATYLSQSGAPGDMAAAVHQYNPNDRYVATVTAYAESMRDQPQLLAAFHGWQVFTSSSAGTVRLPVGYSADAPVDAAGYLAGHPEDAA